MRARWAAAVAGALALGALLHWPGLRSGFALDDYLQLAMIDGWYPVDRSPFDLYAFVDGSRNELRTLLDQGTMPWWSHPELNFHGLRPLTSILTVLDHRLFGYSAFPRHLHSLLWWCALVVAVHVLVRSIARPKLAWLATAIFALDPAHVVPLAWLANRSEILSAFFGVLGMWGHLRWRREGWRAGAAVCAGGFTAALLAGEYGLSMLGYVAAYELLQSTGVRRRLVGLLPAGLPALAYVAVHVGLGCGVVGSSGYLDPFDSPRDFVIHSTVRLPALVVNELITIPSELTHLTLVFTHWSALVLLGVAAVVIALVPGAIRPLEPRERRGVTFVAVGSLLSMLPLLPSLPSARLLVSPSVGGCLVIALLVGDAWRRVRTADERRVAVVPRIAICTMLAAGHLAGAPLLTRFASQMWADSQEFTRTHYLAADIDPDRIEAQDVFVINALDPNTLIFPPYVWRVAGRGMPRAYHLLTMTPHALGIRRVADDAIELSVNDDDEGMLEVPTALFFRSISLPLKEGETIDLARLHIQILEVARWGPSRIRYTFPTSAADPSRVFLLLTPAGIQHATLPAVGREIRLPSVEEWARMARTSR